MNLSIGIIGLPNVGKSTLFNALLKKQSSFAEASAGQADSGGAARVGNFPFTTIEPNIGIVPVPDDRLEKLADVVANEGSPHPSPLPEGEGNKEVRGMRPPIIPATVKFVDIAGLVKGASEGAGLGNKFLSHIREVSVIAHVVRAFEDTNVVREGSIGVREDYETINTELILADLGSAQNQESRIKNNDPQKSLLQKIITELDKGTALRDIDFTKEEEGQVKSLFFLTNKPEIVVLNVSESDYTGDRIGGFIDEYAKIIGLSKERFVVISAKIEAELASLSGEEQKEYLKGLGLQASGLERLIQKAYKELGLISFLTAPASAKASDGQGGKWEVRAWTIRKGSSALEASGEIHTDFIKKFIKAEVVSFEDFVEFGGPARNASPSSASVAGGWKGAREHGKARLEGRDYEVMDGDIIEFKIGT